MYKITEKEIDYILKDIKANGVILEDLQNNLLDHICCIIEHEMTENEDFYKFYRKILPRFFKNELKEIQVETEKLITFKNYYAMKNTLKLSGIGSILFTLFGAILKTFHLPGAGITIVLGGLLFSLTFLPLLIVLKFKDEEKKVDKWVLSLGLALSMMITTGIIFKIMHWPYANFLMLSGVVGFTFGYVPIYFLTRIRRPELRFNTIVNSVLMMACGGLLFSLFDLGYSTQVKQKTEMIENQLVSNVNSLVQSNAALYATKSDNGTTNEFHNISIVLNRELSNMKVKYEKSSRFDYHLFQSVIRNYNQKVKELFPGLNQLKLNEEMVVLGNSNSLSLPFQLDLIQLQVATNENTYLQSI